MCVHSLQIFACGHTNLINPPLRLCAAKAEAQAQSENKESPKRRSQPLRPCRPHAHPYRSFRMTKPCGACGLELERRDREREERLMRLTGTRPFITTTGEGTWAGADNDLNRKEDETPRSPLLKTVVVPEHKWRIALGETEASDADTAPSAPSASISTQDDESAVEVPEHKLVKLELVDKYGLHVPTPPEPSSATSDTRFFDGFSASGEYVENTYRYLSDQLSMAKRRDPLPQAQLSPSLRAPRMDGAPATTLTSRSSTPPPPLARSITAQSNEEASARTGFGWFRGFRQGETSPAPAPRKGSELDLSETERFLLQIKDLDLERSMGEPAIQIKNLDLEEMGVPVRNLDLETRTKPRAASKPLPPLVSKPLPDLVSKPLPEPTAAKNLDLEAKTPLPTPKPTGPESDSARPAVPAKEKRTSDKPKPQLSIETSASVAKVEPARRPTLMTATTRPAAAVSTKTIAESTRPAASPSAPLKVAQEPGSGDKTRTAATPSKSPSGPATGIMQRLAQLEQQDRDRTPSPSRLRSPTGERPKLTERLAMLEQERKASPSPPPRQTSPKDDVLASGKGISQRLASLEQERQAASARQAAPVGGGGGREFSNVHAMWKTREQAK